MGWLKKCSWGVTILARTSPNLFDLLVAIFSGIAAAYVSIKRKGAAIVGAAIATALMPPLAVTGYGLATTNLWIAKGSFFLFMTNFVAIAISVTFVAIFYGYIHYRGKRYLLAQISLSLSVLVILGIPLGVSLKNIAYQTSVTNKAKKLISAHFNEELSRLNDFSIEFLDDHIEIDAVVITKVYKQHMKKIIATELENELGEKLHLTLTQIALTNGAQAPAYLKNLKAKNNLMNAAGASIENVDETTEIKNDIIKQLWFPFKLVNVDQDSGIISIYSQYDRDVSIHNLRTTELTLSKQMLDWIVRILPSQQRLPSLSFKINDAELSQEARSILEDIVWALNSWEIGEVLAVGYVNPNGNRKLNEKLALNRAQAAASYLEQLGFTVEVKTKLITQSYADAKNTITKEQVDRVDIELGAVTPANSTFNPQ